MKTENSPAGSETPSSVISRSLFFSSSWAFKSSALGAWPQQVQCRMWILMGILKYFLLFYKENYLLLYKYVYEYIWQSRKLNCERLDAAIYVESKIRRGCWFEKRAYKKKLYNRNTEKHVAVVAENVQVRIVIFCKNSTNSLKNTHFVDVPEV